MLIIILLIFLIIVIMFLLKRHENFSGEYMSIVDPYSLYLWADISAREDLWNYDHTRKLYYYRDMVPQRYKE